VHAHPIEDYKVGGHQQTTENPPPEFMNNTRFPRLLTFDLILNSYYLQKNII